jgi:hypothetical protein
LPSRDGNLGQIASAVTSCDDEMLESAISDDEVSESASLDDEVLESDDEVLESDDEVEFL